MTTGGLLSNRFVEVKGRADTEPLSSDGDAPENRRVSITLFHSSRYPLAPADDGYRPN